MKQLAAQLLRDEEGGSLIEYVLIAALVVLATAGVLMSEDSGLRPAIKNHFDAKAAPLDPAP